MLAREGGSKVPGRPEHSSVLLPSSADFLGRQTYLMWGGDQAEKGVGFGGFHARAPPRSVPYAGYHSTPIS